MALKVQGPGSSEGQKGGEYKLLRSQGRKEPRQTHGRVERAPDFGEESELRPQLCCPLAGNLGKPAHQLSRFPLWTLTGYQPPQGDNIKPNETMYVSAACKELKE